jgi:TP901 family phage tail tape measure protein
MALDAGSVYVTLGGNFNPTAFGAFGAATLRAKRSMDEVEAATSRMGKVMTTAGKGGALALAGGVLAAGLAIGKSVSLAADFEHQLSLLGSATGANAKQMALLKKSALDAGAATKYSALQAAQAQTALAKGGLSVAQILKGGLTGALALAAAGELDLTQAAETTVNALNNFQLGAGQAGHVADALAKAAVSTTTDVGPLAIALTEAGGSAHSAGVSFDSTVVALEALAKTGVQGSLAGGSLKSAINNLLTPSKKQTEMAKAAGIAVNAQGQAFITAGGNLKSFTAISQELRDKLGGMTKAQRTATEAVLAGSYGQSTLQALYAAGPAKLKRYEQGLNDTGFAARLAAKNQDNLQGKIENLKGSLETAGIQLGEGLLPGLTKGAEKATAAINDLAASGDLTSLGDGMGSVISGMAENLPQITAGFKGLGAAIHGAFSLGGDLLSSFYAGVNRVVDLVLIMGKVFNAISPGKFLDVDLSGLQRFRDELQATQDLLDGKFSKKTNKVVTVSVNANTDAALSAISHIDSAKIRGKVFDILAQGGDAKRTIHDLVALGIPRKTAVIIANAQDALNKISGVKAMMAQITDKTVKLQIATSHIDTGNILAGTSKPKTTEVPHGPGPRAAGRKAGGAETALVGEGRGGELVGNQDSGWQWIDKPTVMGLGPGDYVIPTDPQYSGRALGFMLAAMGVPGYAKGRKGHKAGASKPLPIPAPVTFGAVPEDDLTHERDNARDAYKKRRDEGHKLDVDIRAQRKKVAEAKGADAKRKARGHLKELQDKKGALKAIDPLRRHWQDLEAQVKVLHATNQEIDRLNTIQETDRSKMETAAKRGDAGAWGTAKKDRDSKLATLRDKYAKAVELANPGSNFRAELEGKLAAIEGDIADADSEAFTADSPFDGGLTKEERDQLDRLQADQSLASLTAGLGDDQAAAVATEQFLSNILASAMDGSRGGASVIGDLADQVKQARDNVASLAGGSGSTQNDSADLQAQINRAITERDVALNDARIANLGLSVFQGAGDIGSGTHFTINTLHPGDSRTLAAIAGASVAGMADQASRISPRTNLGL